MTMARREVHMHSHALTCTLLCRVTKVTHIESGDYAAEHIMQSLAGAGPGCCGVSLYELDCGAFFKKLSTVGQSSNGILLGGQPRKGWSMVEC